MVEEAQNKKLLCYYMMNNGIIEEQYAIFEKPDAGMMHNLKPLFIREKMDNIRVNKVFIDGGATLNPIPHSLLKIIGKYDRDLSPYNMVFSNYEGKKSHIFCLIKPSSW